MLTTLLALLISTAPVEHARQDIKENLDAFDKTCIEKGITIEECRRLVDDKDLR